MHPHDTISSGLSVSEQRPFCGPFLVLILLTKSMCDSDSALLNVTTLLPCHALKLSGKTFPPIQTLWPRFFYSSFILLSISRNLLVNVLFVLLLVALFPSPISSVASLPSGNPGKSRSFKDRLCSCFAEFDCFFVSFAAETTSVLSPHDNHPAHYHSPGHS